MSTQTLNVFLNKIKQWQQAPARHWNPTHCGSMNMVIKSDGSWHYMGSAIARLEMVKLFARILRKEADGHYYLVTPVEKIRIEVENTPFIATHMLQLDKEQPPLLKFITNLGDEIIACKTFPIEVTFNHRQEPMPSIRVRDGLYARINRNLYYQLVDIGVEKIINGQTHLGVNSAKQFFSLGSYT